MYNFTIISVEEKTSLLKWFQHKPNGEKIKKRSTKDEFWGSPKHKPVDDFLAEFGIEPAHSVIKINGELYQIATGRDALIGAGQFGKVKFIQHLQTNKQYALKIQNFTLKEHKKKQLLQENEISKDVNLNHAHVIRAYRNEEYKFYSLMPYHGVNLKTLLDEKLLSDKQRIDIAIRLCFEIYKLHSGLLSNSAEPYSHQDIKPANIIINAQGKPVLIDYGLAQKYPKKIHDKIIATPIYMPPLRMLAKKKITQQQIDNFAKDRVLWMPNIAMYLFGIKEDDCDNHHNFPSLLPKHYVEGTPLLELINTGGKDDSKLCFEVDIMTVAAGIILQDSNMHPDYFELIAKHPKLAYITLALYFTEQENSSTQFNFRLNKVFSCYAPNNPTFSQHRSEKEMNDLEKKALAISYGIDESIERACAHQKLMTILASQENLTIKKTAIILFKLDLLDNNPEQYQEKIQDLDFINILRSYPELCPKINEFYHRQQHEKIIQCFHLPVSLTRILRKLKELESIHTIFEISRNSAILKSLLFSRSKEHSQALLYILKYAPTMSFKELDKLNRFQVEALNFLEANSLDNLFSFVMSGNNALLIYNTSRFIQSNLLSNAKHSLPLMLNEICQNGCYVELLKANPKPEAQYIIHHIIESKIEPKLHINYLLLNDKARDYLFNACKDLSLPLSIVRKIMNHPKAMHAFIQLVDVEQEPPLKVIINELQSDIRIAQLNENMQLKPLGISHGLQAIQRNKEPNAIQSVKPKRKSFSDAPMQQENSQLQNVEPAQNQDKHQLQAIKTNDRNILPPLRPRPLSHNNKKSKYSNHQPQNRQSNLTPHQKQECQLGRPPIPWRH